MFFLAQRWDTRLRASKCCDIERKIGNDKDVRFGALLAELSARFHPVREAFVVVCVLGAWRSSKETKKKWNKSERKTVLLCWRGISFESMIWFSRSPSFHTNNRMNKNSSPNLPRCASGEAARASKWKSRKGLSALPRTGHSQSPDFF